MGEEGQIERLTPGEADNTIIAWGSFPDGTTFDLPLPANLFHRVGDAVVVREGEIGEADRAYIVMGDHYATILYCEEDEEGAFAIVNHQIIPKKAN